MTHRFRYLMLFLVVGSLWGCKEQSEQIDNSAEKPDDNRFTPVAVTPEGALDEPMMFQIAPDESIFFIERKGKLKRFDTKSKEMKVVTTLSVYDHNEQGLIGLAIDPDYQTNHWIYLQYAPLNKSIFKLVRLQIENDKVVDGSEKVLLEIPVDRENTNHTGGGMTWDKDGNLYLTVGNNTGNSPTAQTDERPGHAHFDDQRGASNTNDLRGKILRIHPEPNGSYTIPKGNLFPEGTEKTRPEIYTMGHRNVWRVSVDSKTGWIYWGEVGPDQDVDNANGPRGYDEQNQAKGPGYFGWPYFIADNKAIPKNDFVNNKVGDTLDAAKPRNTSPNNTGLELLPSAVPALIYYPYTASEKFPLVGSSSRCAIGGPVYHLNDFKNPQRPFPNYYEGKWLIADFSRSWIMTVTLDEQGNYVSMEEFAPQYRPIQPMDTKFGPDGDFYVLEYGSNPVRSAAEAKLVRIEYNAGNRKPHVKASATKKGGALPFTTTLSGNGSIDFDGDSLTYHWKVDGEKVIEATGQNATVTLDKPGVYKATLTVTDSKGLSGNATVRLVAGNEPPLVKLMYKGNKTFFFPDTDLSYNITVSDQEDGTLGKGIDTKELAVSIDYASEAFDLATVELGHLDLDAASQHIVAESIIKGSDCRTCHTVDVKAVGPSFKQIAEKHKRSIGDIDSLAHSIIHGSSGKYLMDNAMPAHPSMALTDARTIAKYILTISDDKVKSLPSSGKYNTKVPKDDDGRGVYIFRAAYTDHGAGSVPSQTTDTVFALKSPRLKPLDAHVIHGAVRDMLDEYTFLTAKTGSFIAYKAIDMTGVKQVQFRLNWHLYDIYAGGKIEIRFDKPDGELVGETTVEREQFNMRYRTLFGGLQNPTAEQQRRMKRYPPVDADIFFGPGADKSTFTTPSFVTVKAFSGKRDVYFVFKPMTQTSGALFPLYEIVFMNK